MDYRKTLTPDVLSFIDETMSKNSGLPETPSLDEQRQSYNALCAHFHPGRHDEVAIHDDVLATDAGVNIPYRNYIIDDASHHILYIHGGGFVVGGLDTHDDICGSICRDTGFTVTAVDYRLAPEHKHPAALDDCRAVLDMILGKSPNVIVMGDSAGGWLTAMLAYEYGTRLTGQVLIYPMLGGRLDQGSYLDHANAPLLSTEQVKYYWEVYFDCPMREDALTPPMAYEDISMMPPSVILGAGCDPLFSDSPQFAQKLTDHKVVHRYHQEDGLPHGYMRARHSTEQARASYGHVVQGLLDLADGKV